MVSSTRSSKIRILIKIVLFAILFLLMVMFLDALVAPRDSDTRQIMAEFYEHNDLDTLFIGTSATYRSNIPLVIDQEAGLYSFNLTTPAQSFTASYYLLKEALKSNDIRYVVLDVNIARFQVNMVDRDYQYLAIENMKFSWDKLMFMVDGFTIEHYPATLLKCYRAREYMRLASIEKNLTYQNTIDPGDYPEEVYPYLGKGYIFTDVEQTPGELTLNNFSTFDESGFKADNVAFLNKIIALCREKNIELIFLSRPRLAGNIIAGGNYGAFHDYMQGLADEYGIPFWDLVYLRPDVLTIDDTMFMDGFHANYTLALPLSRLLGRMMKEYGEGTLDTSRYLLNNYDEYLKINHRISGLYTGKLDENKVIGAYAVAPGDIEVEYRFSLSMKKFKGYTVVQDWSARNEADLNGPIQAKCWLLVEARQAGANGGAEQCTRKVVDLR